jgi:hypothetical protein
MTQREPHPRLDRWISIAAAAVVGLVIIATVVLWLTAPGGPPEFELEVRPTAHRVEVDVKNIGGEIATEVMVRATFADGSEADQTVTWLSPGESNMVVFFPPDQSSEVEVAVVSFAPND